MSQNTPSCTNCQALKQRLGQVEEQLRGLQTQLSDLQQQLAKAKKNSSTSSKPPSSDIVKAPSTNQQTSPRTQGAQPGHPKQQRQPFNTQELTQPPFRYWIDVCPECGQTLQDCTTAPRVVQQIDLSDVPHTRTEHQAQAGWCPDCKKTHYAVLPPAVEQGGLVGPRLTAWIAYLKGACHASFSTIRKFVTDVLGVRLSRGLLAKVLGKVSAALEGIYQELLQALPEQSPLNVDETGHKDNGERWWTWCFRARLFTLFKIDPSRRAEVLMEVLGREFAGVLGCDYFSAYRRYMRECGVLVQFCLAHLIRDVKFLATLPDKKEQAYGQRLQEGLRQLFAVVHQRENLCEEVFGHRLRQARDHLLELATTQVPSGKHSQTIKKRFEQHGRAYFEFITTPGVEPTNNLAEQAIRFVVLDRQVTQGTRGEAGRNWSERIWTVIASCAQQGRSVFVLLSEAVQAYFAKEPGPSLLPQEV